MSSSADPQQLNYPSSDKCTDIGELKLGQKLNGEAIQTLSHSVLEMALQFQFLVDKSKTNVDNSTSTKATQTCIIRGPNDHLTVHCADVDVSSFVIEESLNLIENNWGIITSQSIEEHNQNNHSKAHSADVDINSFAMKESINPLEINRSIITSQDASADILEENSKSILTTDSSKSIYPLCVCSKKAG